MINLCDKEKPDTYIHVHNSNAVAQQMAISSLAGQNSPHSVVELYHTEASPLVHHFHVDLFVHPL